MSLFDFPSNRPSLERIAIAGTLVLPWLLFVWMLPFAVDFTLGQDYQRFGIDQQLELMFSIEHGTFPLYAPGFAGGHSATALTLGQLYHPLPHLARWLPGYWDGQALEWMSVLRLLSLAVTHLALFTLLRRWQLSPLLAFVIAMMTVYNLRTVDLFRYGPALESWTGHLLLCAAIGHFCTTPSWRSAAAITFASAWLIASGHPQMAYMGALGAGLFALLLPGLLPSIIDTYWSWRRGLSLWFAMAGAMVIGIALVSVYLLPLYVDFLISNPARTSADYTFSTSWSDTLAGTLNNWFWPLSVDVHGAFGGYSWQLMALMAPLAIVFKVRTPVALWCTLLAVVGVFFVLQGERMFAHRLLWEYLPLISLFRVPTRFSMLLPVLLMLLMAWLARQPPVTLAPRTLPWQRQALQLSPMTAIASLCMALSIAYWLSTSYWTPARQFAANITEFSPAIFRLPPSWLEPTLAVCGLASLIALALLSTARGRQQPRTGALLLTATVAQALLTLAHGTWLEHKRPTRTFTEIAAEKQRRLNYQRHPSGLESGIVRRQLQETFLEPWLAQTHERIRYVADIDHLYQQLQQDRRADTVLLLGRGDSDAPPLPRQQSPNQTPSIQLVRATFNQLRFEVHAAGDSVLSLAYPYAPQWQATVNGQRTKVWQANGAGMAVGLSPGLNAVQFDYVSQAAVAGGWISLSTAIATALCWTWRRPRRRWLVGFSTCSASIWLFATWHASLGEGQHLHTRYQWHAGLRTPVQNIAFGKPTALSSLRFEHGPKWFHAGRAVDGDKRESSTAYTKQTETPHWSVDLLKPRRVRRIKIFEDLTPGTTNARPLKLLGSIDGNHWRLLHSILHPPMVRGTELLLEQTPLRHLRIQASGITRLGLREIEVFVE